jgi:hypothetical protein
MTLRLATITTLLLLTGGAAVQAADTPGASGNSPGYQKNEQGAVPGSPGASGYAPGQKMQGQGAAPNSSGASGYAPGRQGANDNPESSRKSTGSQE